MSPETMRLLVKSGVEPLATKQTEKRDPQNRTCLFDGLGINRVV